MDKFLRRHKLPKLSKLIDVSKLSGTDCFTDSVYQTVKKEIISILYKLFQKIEECRVSTRCP